MARYFGPMGSTDMVRTIPARRCYFGIIIVYSPTTQLAHTSGFKQWNVAIQGCFEMIQTKHGDLLILYRNVD